MRGNAFAHWLLYAVGLQSARTQVSPAERDALCRHCAGKRSVVEIGTFEGATARALRETIDKTGTMTCIDPFTPGRLHISYCYLIARQEVSKASRGNVEFLRQTSHEAVKKWNRAIDFLFIDADHSFEAVLRDWQDWKGFVQPAGLVAFHDSQLLEDREPYESEGPVRLMRQLVTTASGFRVMEVVDTLTILRRIE